MNARRVSVLCLTVAAAFAVAPMSAGAIPPSQTAWWNQAQQLPAGAPLAVPAPPTVPAGGLYVANTPGGPAGLSALRFSSDAPADGTLTLKIDSNSAPFASIAAIQACLPLADWKPAENGTWTDVPLYTCTGNSPTLAADGVTLTWKIPAAYQNGDVDYVDVLLAPAADANPFQIALAAPGGDAFAQEDAATTEPAPADEPATDPGPVPTDAFVVPGVTFNDFVPPSVPIPDAAPNAPPRRRIRQPLDRVPVYNVVRRDSDRDQRIAATVALFAIAAAWFWLAGEPSRVPRLLGSVGGGRIPRAALEAPHRGIGRFARPRTGRAPKLG
jgi:hypothetical protein